MCHSEQYNFSPGFDDKFLRNCKLYGYMKKLPELGFIIVTALPGTVVEC